MKIRFYKTADDQNVINKTVEILKELDITFRQAVDRKAPALLLHKESIPDGANYVQIPDFNRYYFMQVTPYNSDLMFIQLNCDLLMTYQDTLLNTQVLVTATSKPSYLSTNLPSLDKTVNRVLSSNVTLPEKSSIILTTIGGIS